MFGIFQAIAALAGFHANLSLGGGGTSGRRLRIGSKRGCKKAARTRAAFKAAGAARRQQRKLQGA